MTRVYYVIRFTHLDRRFARREPVEVLAVVGPFVIHRSINTMLDGGVIPEGRYTVTHRATSSAATMHAPTLEAAIDLAERLCGFQWSAIRRVPRRGVLRQPLPVWWSKASAILRAWEIEHGLIVPLTGDAR